MFYKHFILSLIKAAWSNYFYRCETVEEGPCLITPLYSCNNNSVQSFDPCDVGCPDYYRCRNNACVLRSTICDGNHYIGCPEDDEYKTGIGFQCVRNGEFCRLPQQLLLDDVQDCDQGEDLCYDWPEQSRDGLVRIANRFFFIIPQSHCMVIIYYTVIPKQLKEI